MEYAWLAPVLCVIAFFFNVLISRQTPVKHGLAALVSIAAIVGAFGAFLVTFSDAQAHLGAAAHAAGIGGKLASLAFLVQPAQLGAVADNPRHLLFDQQPWFSIGRYAYFGTLSVDWLSIMMLGVVSFLSALIQIYSLGYMRGDNRFWWFFSVMSLFSAAMLGLVLAYDFLLLYMCWELVGLCSFLLIGFWYQERDNAEAAKKAFITTRIGDVGFFIGLALLFLQTGTFRMDVIFEQIGAGRIDPTIVTVAGLLVFAGAVGKSGQFPLHVWLPDAMAGPTPVSALVHSATMVAAGVYLVGRAYPLFVASPVTMAVIAAIGTITAIFAATIALTQRDIKRVLAYSTVSQLGYMVMALGLGAYTAGLFHLFTHAFFKALLFLGAGSVIHSMESVLHGTGKSPNDIFWMGGLRRQMPITFITFLVAALSLAGIFPLSGFWSKDEILAGALSAGAWLPFIVGLVTAFLTAFYMFRAIYLTFFGEARWRLAVEQAGAAGAARGAGSEVETATGAHHGAATPLVDHEPAPAHQAHGHHAAPHESPLVMTIPLLIIMVPAAVAGWLNIPGVFTAFGDAIYYGEVHHEGMNLAVAALGLLAGLLGIGLATIMYWRPLISPEALSTSVPRLYRLSYNKYYFDEAYQWLIDHVVLVISGLAALFDRKIVNEGVVDRPAFLTARAGWYLRFIQTGRIYNYAFAFIVGIVLISAVMALAGTAS
ncbi:MAG TPA: NADH-quinone oxidoreductase subunit L [Chloroflexota bacterium]|nr:NADH-quinone oxidoreductase subunit L [Chloroflexota bacterium]